MLLLEIWLAPIRIVFHSLRISKNWFDVCTFRSTKYTSRNIKKARRNAGFLFALLHHCSGAPIDPYLKPGVVLGVLLTCPSVDIP